MAGIRGKDTMPEMLVRRHLHAAGLRYRLHDRKLPGAPDLVFPRYRVALFVHGCFWHQHPGCANAVMPKSNSDFWRDKLEGNRDRDARNIDRLEEQGWRVLVVWECEIRDGQFADLPKLIRAPDPTC